MYLKTKSSITSLMYWKVKIAKNAATKNHFNKILRLILIDSKYLCEKSQKDKFCPFGRSRLLRIRSGVTLTFH